MAWRTDQPEHSDVSSGRTAVLALQDTTSWMQMTISVAMLLEAAVEVQ